MRDLGRNERLISSTTDSRRQLQVGLLLLFKKLPEPLIVLGAAVIGWLVDPFVGG